MDFAHAVHSFGKLKLCFIPTHSFSIKHEIHFFCALIFLCDNFGMNNTTPAFNNNETEPDFAQAPILNALKNYKKDPMTGFHIPGHNRGAGVLKEFVDLIGEDVFKLDTTDEFDNLGTLHPATGAIKEAMDLAARQFGAKKTFFLTGGSTVGNLALALGCTKSINEILIGRNCHRSVLTGMVMSGANPCWIIPKKLDDWAIYGAVEPSQIEEQLKNNKHISHVWITNPTYEGIISDVGAISEICNKYNIPLIVDEAHGCLWHFSNNLPVSALHMGADAVVHSFHKTGGSMVQSSMLHISKNSRLNVEKIERALRMMHSTSPSILLLASLDCARVNLSSQTGKEQIEHAIENARYFRESLKNVENISVLNENDGVEFDTTKIFIKIKGLSGVKLEKILEEEFKIEIESASDEGLLILSNIGNSRSEFDYLIASLKKVAENVENYYAKAGLEEPLIKYTPLVDPKIVMSPRTAYFVSKETVKKADAIGRICSQVIALCPPGISVLLPGEIITKEHLPYLTDYEELEVVKN